MTNELNSKTLKNSWMFKGFHKHKILFGMACLNGNVWNGLSQWQKINRTCTVTNVILLTKGQSNLSKAAPNDPAR